MAGRIFSGLCAVVALLAVLAAHRAEAADFYFKSPSGNINCMISDDPAFGGARCDIFDVTRMSFPNRPDDCDLEWGQTFVVGFTGRGEPACVGDTVVVPDSATLPYGVLVSVGRVSCLSTTEGIECYNAQGGSFLVGRNRQSVN